MEPKLYSSPVIKRYENNPILAPKDVPYPCTLLFNAGVAKYQGRYVMIFRNDYNYIKGTRFEGTNLGLAFSDDGINWKVEPEPFFTMDMIDDPEIVRLYDPRLTVIEDELYMCFAVDTHHGVLGGIGKITLDFKKLEIITMTTPDNRNMVLFPEKIDGKYVRLERPFPVYSLDKPQFDIWISKAYDMRYWGESRLLLGVEDVPYANDKIGPGAPPIKTEKGWLVLFHAVDRDDTRGKNGWEDKWTKRYTAGIMLLDLEEPSKVLGVYKEPLIAPEHPFETTEGFRLHAIFPCGMIAEEDGTVKMYYGSADIVECMATAKLEDLIDLCLQGK